MNDERLCISEGRPFDRRPNPTGLASPKALRPVFLLAALACLESPVAASAYSSAAPTVSQEIRLAGLCLMAASEVDPRAHLGLGVHPPVMVIRDVEPGTKVELPAPITVKNSGRHKVQFTLTPLRPSGIGMRRMRGYVDIPDPSWCRPSQCRLMLEPGQSASVPVTLQIPDEQCYANRKWCVALSVETAGTGTVGAAVYPYVYIETNSEDTSPRPPHATDGARALSEDSPRETGTTNADGRGAKPNEKGSDVPENSGCLIISPGSLDAGDVPPGSTGKVGPLTIINGYEKDVFVQIRTLVPSEGELARNVLVTPGHNWIENTGWLHTHRQGLLLLAGKTATFEIDVVSPSNPSMHNFRWEGFLEIRGPSGPEGLVRVCWRTTPQASSDGPLVRTSAE